MRLDIPTGWMVCPRASNVLLFDHAPPDTRYSLGLSWHRIHMDALAIPLPLLLMNGSASEQRPVIQRGELYRIMRPPLEVAWTQLRVADPLEQRELCTRMCVARSGCTQAVALFEFRPDDEAGAFSIWQTFLETLAVGEYIADATTGERREKRG